MNKYEFDQKVKAVIEKMTTEELSFALGRYCNPDSYILSMKKFGFHMPAKLVQEELKTRLFEDAFFLSEEPDKIGE